MVLSGARVVGRRARRARERARLRGDARLRRALGSARRVHGEQALAGHHARRRRSAPRARASASTRGSRAPTRRPARAGRPSAPRRRAVPAAPAGHDLHARRASRRRAATGSSMPLVLWTAPSRQLPDADLVRARLDAPRRGCGRRCRRRARVRDARAAVVRAAADTRPYALVFGLGMHVMIGLMFGPVVWFALLMMTLLARRLPARPLASSRSTASPTAWRGNGSSEVREPTPSRPQRPSWTWSWSKYATSQPVG